MGAIGYSLSNETQSQCCGAVSLGHAKKRSSQKRRQMAGKQRAVAKEKAARQLKFALVKCSYRASSLTEGDASVAALRSMYGASRKGRARVASV